MTGTAALPLSHDAVLRLFIQLAVLVGATRMVAELLRRIRQPPVVGELLAGILLGPTGLGHFAPGAFQALFPPGEPMRLVEAVSWLGMTFLMLLAGLETDVRLLRHLGRPALFASSIGMAVPFALGASLGMLLPGSFVPPDVPRPLLAAFIATAMGISAMPVISRILLDLKLMRRNFGVLVLSAGVVDDTTGWLILSVIAGAAEGGVQIGKVAFTAVGVFVFLAAMRYLVHPVVSRIVRFVDDEMSIEGTDVVFVAVFTFACAAATQALGVHAVFGAFVAGVVLRQAPRLRPESVARLETAALAVFSPVFFAFVGLKVDLWTLPGPGLALTFLGIATLGKLTGCYAGGRLGGMSRWESLALGVAMNARGAMELVVATMGLSLGILDQRLYSVLVLVALVTSFTAPLVLAPLAKRLPMTREEQARIAEAHRHPLAAGAGKVVCVSEEGLAGVRGLELSITLAAAPDSTVVALHPEVKTKRRLFSMLRGGALAHLERLVEAGKQKPGKVTLRSERGDLAAALFEEASRGAALVVLSSASWPPPLVSERGVTTAKLGCALALLHPKRGGRSHYQHLLVPTDGSAGSRLAIEVALAYAAGSGARVTVLHVMERPMTNPLLPQRGLPSESARRLVEVTLEKSLAPLVAAFPEHSRPKVHVQVIEASPANDAIVRETQVGPYDLLVVHASERAVRQGLFFGYGAEFLVGEAACSVLCLLPPEAT